MCQWSSRWLQREFPLSYRHVIPQITVHSVFTWDSHDQRQHELCPARRAWTRLQTCARFNDWLSARLICIRRPRLIYGTVGWSRKRILTHCTPNWSPCSRSVFSAAQHIQIVGSRRYFPLRCRWQWKLTSSVRKTATRRSVASPWIRMSQQVLSIWREKWSMFLSVSAMRPSKCTIKVSQIFILEMHCNFSILIP